jgi:hypothetical protein
MKNFKLLLITMTLTLPAFASDSASMDPLARPTEYSPSLFGTAADTSARVYSAEEQLEVYGGKHRYSEPYYPLLFGRRMYGIGPIDPGINLFGSRNLASPRLMAFGDWRNAYNYSQNANSQVGEINSRLNLDIDLQLTATERFHAFARPLDRDGQFTGCIVGNGQRSICNMRFDTNLDAIFFEGDLGNITSGLTGKPNKLDLPIAAGLMPFVLHNGIWVNDTFRGAAFSIPSMHSRALDIPNFDLTFFHAYEDINTPLLTAPQTENVSIFGTNLFAEMGNSYLELGYGFTDDRTGNEGDYHNVALSHTHRWKNIASLSERVIVNFGQRPGKIDDKETANGVLLLLESSWMTRKPYTFIPYLNLFGGFDRPQGLAKDNGILNNTGILFEADGITSFPFLENSANDTFGGAAGLEYLFNLDQQLVFEIASVQVIGGKFKANRKEKQDEYGFGARYQIPLTKALIWRTDGMFDLRPEQKNIYGVRTELRLKF